VCVVAELYPRPGDPVLGVWAHRQALAARDAGAQVQVLVLDRPIPPVAAFRSGPGAVLAGVRAARARRGRGELDGIPVEYVPFVAPPRELSYAGWHRWARRPLARALERAQPFDLVHAHYALPAGGAARPWTARRGVPQVVSVHGGDVFSPLLSTPRARADVGAVLRDSAGVLANSAATLDRAAVLAGRADHMRVVHLGADAPADPPEKHAHHTVATLGHVIPRKRHEDVLRAVAALHGVRWVVIGDGPELPRLRELADELGAAERVTFTGQLAPADALRELARCHVMALPSVDEAFGVAYVEALACGVPAIGLAGEGGPEEIAALGGGMTLVPPADAAALRAAIADTSGLEQRAAAARATANEHFTWEATGRATVAAYEAALGR
jgi:glycosyltransferase involved in cell wall biosynthesis